MQKGEINMTSEYKRGDIVLVNFEGAIGSEQKGIRPALIVQNDTGNKYSPTVLIAPLTKQVKHPNMPTHINVTSDRTTNLKVDSVLICEQIRVIDKTRIQKKTGQISENMVKCIDNAIAAAFGLCPVH